MAVDVFASDEQQDVAVDLSRWVSLARSVLQARGVRGPAEVSLLFVDGTTMARLNEEFLRKSGPTDVLAFPIEDLAGPGGRFPDAAGPGPGSAEDGSELLLLGDVVICPAVAAENASEHEVDLEDEMALLVVHGLLHLLGMDHEDEAEAEAMERLERKLLARYHQPTSGARKD